jgi:hypothetical protein
MRDFHWEEPNTDEIELIDEELAELNRRREAAKNGRWYTMEEVRQMMQQQFATWNAQRPPK